MNLCHVLYLTLRAQKMTLAVVSLIVVATRSRDVFLLTMSVTDTWTVQTAKTKGQWAGYITNISFSFSGTR